MKKALIFDVYDDYTIRIQFIKKALERNGYDVKIFFADYDHYRKEYYKEHRTDVNYIHVKSYRKNLSVSRMKSHYDFADACMKAAGREEDVSLIYVMVPPNSMVRAFSKYKKQHPEVKLWFDVLDMWPESLPFPSGMKTVLKPVTSFWRKLRDNSLNCADIITPECDLFGDTLKPFADDDKFHTVYLCQQEHFVHSLSSYDTLRFLYCGSINHLIDIDTTVQFLSEVQKYKPVHVEIIGGGENKDTFLSALQDHDISCTWHGILYDEEEKKKIYERCHYGLNIMKDTVYVGLTMKSMDYLSHGLPLINNIPADTASLVDRYRFGFNLDKDAPAKTAQLSSAAYHDMQEQAKTVFQNIFAEEVINHKLDEVISILESETAG